MRIESSWIRGKRKNTRASLQRIKNNVLEDGLTSFMPSSLPRLFVPRNGGKAMSCQLPLPELHICRWSDCEECSPRDLLLLLRLSRRCLALDFLTGAAGSSSGSLCTSQRNGDLYRRRGLVGEVTGEVNLCTRVPNMVIINRSRLTASERVRLRRDFSQRPSRVFNCHASSTSSSSSPSSSSSSSSSSSPASPTTSHSFGVANGCHCHLYYVLI